RIIRQYEYISIMTAHRKPFRGIEAIGPIALVSLTRSSSDGCQ
ncbi:MAG: hypothetical protein ACI9EB_000995, partial [Pseudomonas sp.]